MTTLVLVFRKIERKDKIKFDKSYSSSKAELMMFLNHSIPRLYQTYKSL